MKGTRVWRVFLLIAVVLWQFASSLTLPSQIRRQQEQRLSRRRLSQATITAAKSDKFFSDEKDSASSSADSSVKLDTLIVAESQFFDAGDISDEVQNDGDLRYTQRMEELHDWEDYVLLWTPMVMPVLAYVSYDTTAFLFSEALEALANNNWVAVDGGDYQAKIIAPAVNGVVVPAISILFANLIGTTISTLRQRQFDIRTAINMEAGQLRILQSLLDVFPTSDTRTSCRRYLTQYTSRLIAESHSGVHIDALDFSLDTELNAVLDELNRITLLIQNDNKSKQETVPELVVANAFASCSRLYDERARRITALRSLFPPLHFVIVATLAVSICTAFLLESNQVVLVFLNAIQLRILWTMLVGVFSSLAIVCYDLGNPFRGSYQISKAVDQLYTIRLTLRTSLYLDQKQQQQQEQLQKEQMQKESPKSDENLETVQPTKATSRETDEADDQNISSNTTDSGPPTVHGKQPSSSS